MPLHQGPRVVEIAGPQPRHERTQADLAEHQRSDGWIPPASINNYTLPLFDYPLHWVVSSWEYVLYTGDTRYANTYYNNLKAVLDQWYVSVTDHNNLHSKGMAGTTGYGDYAFLPRSGEVTYYNALYVLALQSASAWATLQNDTTASRRWSNRQSYRRSYRRLYRRPRCLRLPSWPRPTKSSCDLPT